MHCISNPNTFIHTQVNLPSSKSIINRLLVIHHFSGSQPVSEMISGSSDTVVMQNLLREIQKNTGIIDKVTEINVGNAGTVMRFLTALLAVTPGQWLITGTERMQQRPVRPLTDALQSLGADLSFEKSPGYPPVNITGNQNLRGGTVKLNAGISSQFISAMMMLGPLLKGGLEIDLQGNIISASYIRMTQALMQKAGAEVIFNENILTIAEGKYNEFDVATLLEPDWSAAAFWYQMAAFVPDAKVFLKDLKKQSVQGDSVLPDIYAHLGINSLFAADGLRLVKSGKSLPEAFTYDFTDCPDLAQAVIVTCAGLGIKGQFTGLGSLRVKETDRIEALRAELTKLGYGVEVIDDRIILNGNIPSDKKYAENRLVKCYDDHRMAMAFAPLALLHEKICLDEPHVVVKSYPGFWEDLVEAGFFVHSA